LSEQEKSKSERGCLAWIAEKLDSLIAGQDAIMQQIEEIKQFIKGFAAQQNRELTVDEVKQALQAYEKDLVFSETDMSIIVKPSAFLGRDKFKSISSVLRSLQPATEYVSAGKESHFRVPKVKKP